MNAPAPLALLRAADGASVVQASLRRALAYIDASEYVRKFEPTLDNALADLPKTARNRRAEAAMYAARAVYALSQLEPHETTPLLRDAAADLRGIVMLLADELRAGAGTQSCSPAADTGTTDDDLDDSRECRPCEGTGEGRAGSSCIGCGGRGVRDAE